MFPGIVKELLCEKSKWQDLSFLHKRIREELEKIIREYAGGVDEEFLTPIIVAPYGSGKSELLKYLCCFCWKQGIPVLYIKDFNLIVEELKKRIPPREEKIHESRLPDLLVEFFKENLKIIFKDKDLINVIKNCCNVENVEEAISNFFKGRVRGVLLIDEIEEAYDEFRKLISYDTSPFRKLYDRIRTRDLDIFVIMAFGPSSIAKETVSLAGGWRTKLYSIPFIAPSTIYDYVVKRIKYDKLKWTAQYIANMIWFASKGRIGWVHNLISEGLVDTIIENLHQKNLSQTLLHGENLLDTLTKEIIEETPLFNYDAYITYLSKTDHKELFKILSVLVGPVSEIELKNLIDIKEYSGLKLEDMFVKGEKLVNIEDIVDRIKYIVENTLRKSSTSENKVKKKTDIVNALTRTLEIVLEAWSTNKLLLLPQDGANEPIKNLVELASSMLLEQYQAEASNILDQIDINNVIRELRIEKRIYEDGNLYYALHPKVLVEIYPPIMLKPLLACSKNRSLNLVFRNIDTYLNVNDRIHDYMRKACVQLLPIGKVGISVFIVPLQVISTLTKEFRSVIVEEIRNNKLIILVPIGRSGAELENVTEMIKKEFSPFIELGLVSVADNIGSKLSLFLYGCMFSILECSSEFAFSLRNNQAAKYIFNQYTKSYKYLIEQQISRITRANSDAQSRLRKIFGNHDIVESVNKLIRSKGRDLGSRQARYFWFFSLVGREIRDKFVNIIKCLSKIAEELEDIEDNLYVLGYEKEIFKTAFDKLRLLSRERSTLDYLYKVLDLRDKLKNIDDILESYKRLLRLLTERYPKDVCTLRLEEVLNDIYEQLPDTMKVIDDPENPIVYYLLGESIKEVINEKCKNRYISYAGIREKIDKLVNQLNDTIISINQFRQKINEVLDEPPQVFMKNINELLDRLNNIKNALEKLHSIYLEINSADFASSLDYFSYRIIYDFIIDSIIKTFIQNLVEPKDPSRSFKVLLYKDIQKTIDSINGIIDIIVKKTNRLEPLLNKVFNTNIKDAIRKDLNKIFNTDFSLNKIKANLEKYLNEELKGLEETLESYKEYMKYKQELNRLILEFEKIVVG